MQFTRLKTLHIYISVLLNELLLRLYDRLLMVEPLLVSNLALLGQWHLRILSSFSRAK